MVNKTTYSKEAFSDHYEITVKTPNKNLIRKIELLCVKEVTMEFIQKEVYFDQYCKTCKHFDKKEVDDPCDECLKNPVNTYSHKPTEWEEKEE